jgi:hypothetical protein
MKKQKLKIVFTDGQIKKKIAWATYSLTGWEVGFGYKKADNQINQDVHYTHHDDGVLNWHFYDEKKYCIGKGNPLTDFTGIMRLFGANTLPQIHGEVLFEDYTYRSNDVVLYVDVRKFLDENARIKWSIYLLEPSKTELLSTLDIAQETDFHIFTTFEPWVVVSISK